MLKKIKSYKENKEFVRYFSNTLWLFSEKILRMFIALGISIWLARYLGPEQFGTLNYSLALITMLGVFVYLGLSGVLVHELVDKPNEENKILGTAFYLKLGGAFFAFLLVIVIAFFTTEYNSTKFWLIIIMGTSLLVRPFEVIDFLNEAKVTAKYSAKSKIYSFVISSVFKVFLILTSSSLLYFGFALPLEFILINILLIYYFNRNNTTSNIKEWKFCYIKAKELLSKSWKLIFSVIFATIYLKIDQIMLSWIIDDKEVGIYSVASMLSEAWYFIPIAIVSSLFPKLIENRKVSQKKYLNNLQKTYDLLFLMALSIAIIVTFFSKDIINILYGSTYEESALILTIHIWAGVFIFMRTLFSRWIIMENLLLLSLYTQGFGALLNVILNFFLIEKFGGVGAAIATLISYSVASYFALFVLKQSRGQAILMTKSLLIPLRIIKHKGNIWKI